MAENNISVNNNMQAQMADIFRDTPIEAEKAGEYLSQFRMLMTYYRCAMKEVVTKFEVLDEEFSLRHDRDPISSIQSRLKSGSSIYEKLKRRNLPVSIESIENNLADIAGIRVICPFLEDVYYLEKALLAQDPRPHYHDDPERIYGMLYGDKDVRFRVEGNKLTVISID